MMKRSLLVTLLVLFALPSSVRTQENLAPADPLAQWKKLAQPDGRIIVKFVDGARIRLRPEGLVSLARTDIARVRTILSDFSNPPVDRLFAGTEESIDQELKSVAQTSGRRLADLNSYYEITVAPKDTDRFVNALNQLAVVEIAYPAPVPAPPPIDIPPTTPQFESRQGYLNAAPIGIDARAAWTFPGGRGEGISIVDIEYSWRDNHEDLESAAGKYVCGIPGVLEIEHGTAVLGELIGGENGYGVTGIAYLSNVLMATAKPSGGSYSVARAIQCASNRLQSGDVILIEHQFYGPHNDNFVPVEWQQAEYDAIYYATAKKIVVIEAAGNGNENLDDPIYKGKFNPSVRDSGAIMVGAGAPPDTNQPARSRLSFSNYGTRLNVQGWGSGVITTGYGSFFNGDNDPEQYYTSFSGTSSASPIIAGAAAILQGLQKAAGGQPVDPRVLRDILINTGSPQISGPYAGRIGPLPNLKAAMNYVEVNNPPVANAGEDRPLDCEGHSQAMVLLNGSASTDADSTPGTNDDIQSFEWSENGMLLAIGEQVSLPFQVGVHVVQLKVTDRAGANSADDIVVTVQDTIAPSVDANLTPIVQPGPNGNLIFEKKWEVDFSASDTCDDALETIAVMKIPAVPPDTVINYLFSPDPAYSEINFYTVFSASPDSPAGMEIECKGIDEVKVRNLLKKALDSGGFVIADGQILVLRVNREEMPGSGEGTPYGGLDDQPIEVEKQLRYSFTFLNEDLTGEYAQGPGVDALLSVTTHDHSGNVAAKEVSLVQKMTEICQNLPNNIICTNNE